jgi:hypothetical protein
MGSVVAPKFDFAIDSKQDKNSNICIFAVHAFALYKLWNNFMSHDARIHVILILVTIVAGRFSFLFFSVTAFSVLLRVFITLILILIKICSGALSSVDSTNIP